MTSVIPRYIHASFCDDVRIEVGDKLTFVGCYQGVMNISTQGIPALLPKLCIAVSAHTPLDDLFQKLRFRVMKDDVLLVESEVPREQLQARTEDDPTAKFRTIAAVFTISPFVVDKDCTLRVYADTERGEVVSLGLKVKITLDPAADTAA